MHVCLILFPGFQLLAYALACDVLRVANRLSDQTLFSFEARSVAGREIPSDQGLAVATRPMDDLGARGYDLVLLCAGNDPSFRLPMGLRAMLLNADQVGATLGGLDDGSLILARLGLLQGRVATLSPQADQDLHVKCPGIALSERSFVFDRQRLTCRGGLAAADALFAWIARVHSTKLANDVADELSPGASRIGTSQPYHDDPVLAQMQAIMATQLDVPIPLEHIAAELNLSLKQLRTRCRNGLQQTPAQIYLSMRMERAARLVADTNLTVSDVAHATGFSSPSSFTRSFKTTFGRSPREARR